MNMIKESLIDIIDVLETKPLIVVNKMDFHTLWHFLSGYLYGIGAATGVSLGEAFRLWLQERNGIKASITWAAYIHIIISNSDEELAIKKTLSCLKEFVESREFPFK